MNVAQNSTDSTPRQPFGPLILWMLIQLAALSLSAGQVPFAAIKSFPKPAELIATQVMLTVQIGGSALLFPYLMRDLVSTILIIAASWPMTALAECLGSQTQRQVMGLTALYVTAWLAGLGFWRIALRSARAKAIGISAASLVTIGGMVLAYLRSEYSLATAPKLAALTGYSPILGSIVIATQNSRHPLAWGIIAAHLALGLLAAIAAVFVPTYK
jgi:hypothetical protein